MEIREINKNLQKKQNINTLYFVLILCFLLSVLFYFKGFEGGFDLLLKIIFYPIALMLMPFFLPFVFFPKIAIIILVITFMILFYYTGKFVERG